MNKETERLFSIVSFFAFFVTFILSFMNSAFISACMLMFALFLFTLCYMIKDNNKKKLLYILFTVGVLLIIGSLIYMFMRIY